MSTLRGVSATGETKQPLKEPVFNNSDDPLLFKGLITELTPKLETPLLFIFNLNLLYFLKPRNCKHNNITQKKTKQSC